MAALTPALLVCLTCAAAWVPTDTSAQPDPVAPATASPAASGPLPVARFATLSADRVRELVPAPPLTGSAAEAAELIEVLVWQAKRNAADIQSAADDVRRAPVAWAQWLLGDSFDAARHPLAMRLLLDVHDNARVVVGVANASFDFRLRPWVHAQVQPSLKSEQTGRERYQAGLATGLTPLAAARAVVPSSYPSARTLATRLWAHALSTMWPEKSSTWFEAAQGSAKHRLVNGAHFPSDLQAALVIAYAVWKDVEASSTFQAELAAALTEIAAQRQDLKPSNDKTPAASGVAN